MKSSVQFLQGLYHNKKHYLGGNVDRYRQASLLPTPEWVSLTLIINLNKNINMKLNTSTIY